MCDSYYQHGLKFRCYAMMLMNECSCGGDPKKCDFAKKKKKPASMRDRMIELVTAALCNQSAEEVADCLISNGVILQDFKLVDFDHVTDKNVVK